jgi:protein-tyrosine phosphatase
VIDVLFVCLGNICRSPAAEGIFRRMIEAEGLADAISADSAGTAGWHVGQPPDSRAQAEARRRGVDISGLRGRQVSAADFERFDYVIALDDPNFQVLSGLCPPDRAGCVHGLLEFAPEAGRRDVPDPYYGGPESFRLSFDLIEAGARGLLEHIRRTRL